MNSNHSDITTKLILHNYKHFFPYKSYSKGDFILQESNEVENIYFISSGLVKLSYIDDQAKESILSFAFENWWETDFSAFYNQERTKLYLQCIEDTEVYCLSYEHYHKLIEEENLANYFLDKAIKGHITSQKRIFSLLTHDPKQLYEQFLKDYPSLLQRIPKSTLALYLGVSRETLSRLHK